MNRFTFTMMTHEWDVKVDTLLKESLKSGLKKVSTDNYYIYAYFNNGLQFEMWNANKYYGWLHRGTVYDESGDDKFKWINKRPSRKTMAKFYRAINKFEGVDMISDIIKPKPTPVPTKPAESKPDHENLRKIFIKINMNR